MTPHFNPWHDVSRGDNLPHTVQSIIEIPKGSKGKYELDKESGLLKLAARVKLEDIFPSTKKMDEYFMKELAKKDKQIEELKFELNECKITKPES